MPDKPPTLRYVQVAEMIRAQIADGILKPGSPAPSGAALAVAAGYSVLTCRKALALLVREGTLYAGVSSNARPRVGGNPAHTDSAARAAAALSSALAHRRHAAEVTQRELADVTGYSETTIGHAETGRLWQARTFWEAADKALNADWELVRLYDAYDAASHSADGPVTARPVSVTIIWADGTSTTVHQPQAG